MYLYVFEDQSIGFSNELPTAEDLLCVKGGILSVIDMYNAFELNTEGEWVSVEESLIKSYVDPERGEISYHEIPQ
jgi:hypothetical protein